jgi:hypothetical protein
LCAPPWLWPRLWIILSPCLRDRARYLVRP